MFSCTSNAYIIRSPKYMNPLNSIETITITKNSESIFPVLPHLRNLWLCFWAAYSGGEAPHGFTQIPPHNKSVKLNTGPKQSWLSHAIIPSCLVRGEGKVYQIFLHSRQELAWYYMGEHEAIFLHAPLQPLVLPRVNLNFTFPYLHSLKIGIIIQRFPVVHM